MISIVVTTYNRSLIVSKAIDSIISFFANLSISYEIIVIDDCSSDNTHSHIASTYPLLINSNNLRYFRLKKNRGVTGAKNFGFVKAQYEWVVFLDSDDELYAPHASMFVSSLAKYSHSPLLFFRCIDQHGMFVGKKFCNDRKLDLPEYLVHSSWGEGLVVVNKKMLAKPPFYTALRGYEGLGCLDIIHRFGPSVLVNVVARTYHRDGADRLSTFKHFVQRGDLLANGHLIVLKKYGHMLPFRRYMKLALLAFVYYILNRVAKR